MGTPWDFFDERSHTDNPSISPVAEANRQLLKGFMEAAGFRPYYAEWWHFTLDDEPLPNTYLDEGGALALFRLNARSGGDPPVPGSDGGEFGLWCELNQG